MDQNWSILLVFVTCLAVKTRFGLEGSQDLHCSRLCGMRWFVANTLCQS